MSVCETNTRNMHQVHLAGVRPSVGHSRLGLGLGHGESVAELGLHLLLHVLHLQLGPGRLGQHRVHDPLVLEHLGHLGGGGGGGHQERGGGEQQLGLHRERGRRGLGTGCGSRVAHWAQHGPVQGYLWDLQTDIKL